MQQEKLLKIVKTGTVPATDGRFSKLSFEKTFDLQNGDIEKSGCYYDDPSTAETEWSAALLVRDAKLQQMFLEAQSLAEDPQRVFFTKSQIKLIFENEFPFFEEKKRTYFFPYINENKIIVIFSILHFYDNSIWHWVTRSLYESYERSATSPFMFFIAGRLKNL